MCKMVSLAFPLATGLLGMPLMEGENNHNIHGETTVHSKRSASAEKDLYATETIRPG
jgi:hypothetical protein